MYKKVENLPGYVRDPSSSAIINNDISALTAYKQRRDYLNNQHESVLALSKDINTVKQEMQDIKIMLAKILDK
tara:strand:+ start:6148 stop:6366 length:219 start_codon:yes stop_codon:yes gene_type:complete